MGNLISINLYQTTKLGSPAPSHCFPGGGKKKHASYRGNRMCTQMSPLWMANQSMNDYQRLMFLVPLPLKTIQPFNTLELEVAAHPRIKTQALCHGIIALHILPGSRSIYKQPTLPPRSCRFFHPVTQEGTQKTAALRIPSSPKISTVTAACWSSFEPFFLSGYFEGSWAGKKNRTAISCDFFWMPWTKHDIYDVSLLSWNDGSSKIRKSFKALNILMVKVWRDIIYQHKLKITSLLH